MDIGFSVLAFIVAIGVLVTVHEFGHYAVARALGVKVLRFSVGFGKPIWTRRAGRDQTEYVLAALPLGGYVKMLDENEGDVPAEDLHRAFNRQSYKVRSAIVLAGPSLNFLFAIFIYWLLFVSGIPGVRPVIGEVMQDSPANAAGLRAGDEITSVSGRDTPTWEAARMAILKGLIDDQPIELMAQATSGAHVKRVLYPPTGKALPDDGAVLGHLGIVRWRPQALIGAVSSDGAGARAGFRRGDRVLSIDQRTVSSWGELVKMIRENPGKDLTVRVERNAAQVELLLTPVVKSEDGKRIGYIGVAPEMGQFRAMRTEQRFSPLGAIGAAFVKTWDVSALILQMLGKMVIGEASIKNISGPITIAQYAGETASLGLGPFVHFLALVSISLGVLNLLPIPLLDGGHLLYYLIEIVKGGALSERAALVGQQAGLVLLIGLMSLAFYNDLIRVFG